MRSGGNGGRRWWSAVAVTVAALACHLPARPDATASLPAEHARAAFRRFKDLEGSWKGVSTNGWTERTSYRSIAGGSAVLQTSFDAHPDETMLTLIHPDGDRLLLTHYCVAGNQPRLVLSGYERDGARLTFTFLDGTNLPSRDAGHMDQVVFEFDTDRTFSRRWTWFEKGKERWLEEIRSTRVDSLPPDRKPPTASHH